MLEIEKLKIKIFELENRYFVRDVRCRRGLWLVFMYVLALFMVSSDIIGKDIDLKVGQKSPYTIKSPAFIEVRDLQKTQEMKQLAADKVAKSYDLDVTVLEQIIYNVNLKLDKITQIENNNASITDKRKEVRLILADAKMDNLSDAEIDMILQMDAVTINNIKSDTAGLINPLWDAGVKNEDLEKMSLVVSRQIDLLDLNELEKNLMVNVVLPELRGNMIFNSELTQKRIDEAERTVPEFRKQIMRDQIIIAEGDEVTEQHIIELEALGLKQTPFNYRNILGQALLLFVIISVLIAYIYFFCRPVYKSERNSFLLGLILLFAIGCAKAVDIFINVPLYSGYLIPSAASALLIALLLDKRLAIFSSIFVAIVIGMITDFKLNFVILSLLVSIVSVMSVSRLNQRMDLIISGLINSLTAFTVVFALEMVNGLAFTNAFIIALYGIVNGVFSSILAGGLLPFLEVPFGILTEPKLLELSNPNHPLLKKLLIEAPGTYHHSVIVGNLAEAGARAVGASTLLARAGAYYHDIGKIKRPYFYIENQMMKENPHDKLSPSLSTLVITSHTKVGAELARAYRLPREIIYIIQEHHGTSLLSYFYHRALDSDSKQQILESDYRYPGPKPRSKEAAIVMLADSVEASLRSMGKPTPGVIESLVRKIFRDKLNDDQLGLSELTFHDLEKIMRAFLTVLAGIYHTRIEYPDEAELKELEKRRNNGRSNN